MDHKISSGKYIEEATKFSNGENVYDLSFGEYVAEVPSFTTTMAKMCPKTQRCPPANPWPRSQVLQLWKCVRETQDVVRRIYGRCHKVPLQQRRNRVRANTRPRSQVLQRRKLGGRYHKLFAGKNRGNYVKSRVYFEPSILWLKVREILDHLKVNKEKEIKGRYILFYIIFTSSLCYYLLSFECGMLCMWHDYFA